MHKHHNEINVLTSEQLITIIDSDIDVVVVDCRSSMEFETCHIRDAVNVGGTRVSRRDLIQRRQRALAVIDSALRHQRPERQRERAATANRHSVVVYDQCSSEPRALHAQSVARAVLEDLAAAGSGSGPVYFLQGGFIGFQSKYTGYCWVNKHKLPDEDFVTPSQSMSRLNQSITDVSTQEKSDKDKSNKKLQNVGGKLLTRSHTMTALSGRFSLRNDPPPTICVQHDNEKSEIVNSDLFLPHHSLSGPALPFGNQGPTTVLKHLLLGSQKDALNQTCIQQHKITHVINVSTDGSVCPFIAPQNFLRIPVLDNFTDKITHYFPKAFEFLDNVKSVGGRALVHCSAGISRSPTLAIGYLMKTQNITVSEAYNIVKMSRSSVSPNFNFMGQLTDYEEELRTAREESKMPSMSNKLSQSRPKRRPSRLGFLSTFLRQSSSSSKSNSDSLQKSESNISSNSLTNQKITTSLLPSPSVPFAKLGINSPLDENPSLTLKIDNFPSTSLDQLHFQPCQTGPRGVKIKRSATESGNDSSKIRKRLSMLDSFSFISQKISPDDSNTDSQCHCDDSNDFPRRHSAVITTTISNDTSPNKSSIDRDHLSTSNRSISFERLNCTEANWNSGSTIISDSCRLQECHQSTSSLSSANSHSSNLLV